LRTPAVFSFFLKKSRFSAIIGFVSGPLWRTDGIGGPLFGRFGIVDTRTALSVRLVSTNEKDVCKKYANLLGNYLYRAPLPPPWTTARFVEQARYRLVAEAAGIPVGFILVGNESLDGREVGPGFNWVEDLVVDPEWRRRGIATKLERAAVQLALREPGLILTSAFEQSRIDTFLRHGWVPHRRAFDAFLMETPSRVLQYPRR
jgi:GNAT superfamily N-acetyltransferase